MRKIQFVHRLMVVGWLVFVAATNLTAQSFTLADSLLGSLNPHRTCYDVTHYTLDLVIHPDEKRLEGRVDITFQAVEESRVVQVDLAENMEISGMTFQDRDVLFERIEGTRAIKVFLGDELVPGSSYILSIGYGGHPRAAKHAPWDGGFVWASDTNNNHWIGVACEGEGASIWWPCKDHLSDEPDSVRMIYNVPKGLLAVGNGRLKDRTVDGNRETFVWEVVNPINNYNITLNIADYAHIQDHYISKVDNRTLDIDYYVLSYNKEVAEKHFAQVKPMMECFEDVFGKYPFYEDGYKLVETPYLGMEHQSAIAYGNHYLEGYLGRDDSKLGFDYIIIHETGHEWFGNSVSTDDLAALWIHESFTTYTEAIYVECMSTYEDAVDYLNVQRGYIANHNPILGPRGVHFDGWDADADQYYKGSWMMQTLRAGLDDDEQWFELLHDFPAEFRHEVTNTEAVIQFFQERLPFDAEPVMYQYLRHTSIPTLEYRITTGKKKRYTLEYRWRADEKGFALPTTVYLDKGQPLRLTPASEWQEMNIVGFKPETFSVDTRQYYIRANQLDKP